MRHLVIKVKKWLQVVRYFGVPKVLLISCLRLRTFFFSSNIISCILVYCQISLANPIRDLLILLQNTIHSFLMVKRPFWRCFSIREYRVCPLALSNDFYFGVGQ